MIENNQCAIEAQAGAERKQEAPPTKMENRLSFDFCELSADQLLESTPASYRIDRANGSVFSFPKDTQFKHTNSK